MPAGVSQTRCGGLPRRGASVVPFSTMAPTAALLKPAILVYSSPKPTQPDRSTIGELSLSPQKSTLRRLMSEWARRLARRNYPRGLDQVPLARFRPDRAWRRPLFGHGPDLHEVVAAPVVRGGKQTHIHVAHQRQRVLK